MIAICSSIDMQRRGVSCLLQLSLISLRYLISSLVEYLISLSYLLCRSLCMYLLSISFLIIYLLDTLLSLLISTIIALCISLCILYVSYQLSLISLYYISYISISIYQQGYIIMLHTLFASVVMHQQLASVLIVVCIYLFSWAFPRCCAPRSVYAFNVLRDRLFDSQGYLRQPLLYAICVIRYSLIPPIASLIQSVSSVHFSAPP